MKFTDTIKQQFREIIVEKIVEKNEKEVFLLNTKIAENAYDQRFSGKELAHLHSAFPGWFPEYKRLDIRLPYKVYKYDDEERLSHIEIQYRTFDAFLLEPRRFPIDYEYGEIGNLKFNNPLVEMCKIHDFKDGQRNSLFWKTHGYLIDLFEDISTIEKLVEKSPSLIPFILKELQEYNINTPVNLNDSIDILKGKFK